MKRICYFVLTLFLFMSFFSEAQQVSLTPQEFYDQIKGAAVVQLVDLRAAKDFQKGYIKKAYNIDYEADNFEEILLQTFSKAKPIYIYCMDGVRSTDAKVYLKELGFANVIELSGGFSNWTRSSKPYVTKSQSLQPIVGVTENDFNVMVQKNPIVLVDFYATWCGPCKKQDPILAKLTSENKSIKLLKIDAESSEGLAKRFDINEIPTLILFKNGKQVWRDTGLKTEAELKKVIGEKR